MGRLVVPLVLALADVLTIVGATLLAIFLRDAVLPAFGLTPFSPILNYATLWPVLGLFVLARAMFGLYPGYGVHSAEELRRGVVSTVVVVFFVLAGSALFQFSNVYSRAVLVLTGGLVLVGLPLVRAFTKALLSRAPFYGEPLWVIGTSPQADALVAILEQRRVLGLRVAGRSSSLPERAPLVRTCLVVPDPAKTHVPSLLDGLYRRFERVWLVPDLLEVASVWVIPRDLEGHIALELRNNLVRPVNRFLKRTLDLTLMLLLLPLILPLLLVLALMVRLDSQGPALFGHKRVGRGGKTFTAWKFRTMHADAGAQLAAYLASRPEAKLEWRETRKLRRDPRVTRLGTLLRRLSLDELPQAWNVIMGDMSLVGPRPIMADELEWYGDRAHLYTRVRPGITGLWQVSGRNTLSYAERVRLDAYYVRNWSLWLDLVIMSQTVAVVLKAEGAY